MESTSLTKALGLLEATAGHPDGRSLADLAAEVGMPKPTAHRILKTLTALGYLERPASGVYRQSPQVQRLVSDAAVRRLIDAAARPLRDLHAKTKETVNLGILRHDRVIYLDVLECTLPLRRVATRTSDPFHTTALGRAIAARLPAELRSRLLDRARLTRRTNATITDRRRLAAEIERTARRGYAIEENETDVGVACIGMAVCVGDGAAGAISVSLPIARLDAASRRRLVDLVRKTARSISARLNASPGGRPTPRPRCPSPRGRAKRARARPRCSGAGRRFPVARR
jgi:DNA-binding IclR family transcriptional regulator